MIQFRSTTDTLTEMQFLIVTLFMIALTKSAVWSVIQPDDTHDALPKIDLEEGREEERTNMIAPGKFQHIQKKKPISLLFQIRLLDSLWRIA